MAQPADQIVLMNADQICRSDDNLLDIKAPSQDGVISKLLVLPWESTQRVIKLVIQDERRSAQFVEIERQPLVDYDEARK